MNLTTEQLDKIEEAAALFLTPYDIAILLDINTDDFIQIIHNPDCEPTKRYNKGKTIAKFEIRKNIVENAKKGSTSAQDLIKQYMIDQDKAERK